jgi:tetratricopeptide (TPR) repeat protein
MNKLALNFICKNEERVIERMLNSSNAIFDLIVAVDTGSTDSTIELIKKYGEEKGIPTYVFERPFDTFDKSRNFAMDKLREVAKDELKFDLEKTWGMWYDCDEQLSVGDKFSKEQLNKDIFMINANIGAMKYTRNTFFRLSLPFRWYGVVHEYIVCDQKNISSGLIENIVVNVSMDGHSWSGDISKKYLDHAHRLESYLADDRTDPRWIFYAAQSYHDSANVKDNREENEERLRRAMKFYKERTTRKDGYTEEIYYSQYRIGTIMAAIEEPWIQTKQELLKAYSIDPERGESFKIIIDHYLQMSEWNMAYVYSKFCIENFHQKNPFPRKLLFLDQALYAWKFLEAHCIASFYTGRKEEAVKYYNELMDIIEKTPEMFNEKEIEKIKSNRKFFQ